ncbi:MAG: hypothetical protein EA402_04365 [Planctomycetota bacterium]|nr:MAG: hypothetical protein EA402_04365 [Planctomycetota bacterium]
MRNWADETEYHSAIPGALTFMRFVNFVVKKGWLTTKLTKATKEGHRRSQGGLSFPPLSPRSQGLNERLLDEAAEGAGGEAGGAADNAGGVGGVFKTAAAGDGGNAAGGIAEGVEEGGKAAALEAGAGAHAPYPLAAAVQGGAMDAQGFGEAGHATLGIAKIAFDEAETAADQGIIVHRRWLHRLGENLHRGGKGPASAAGVAELGAEALK